MRPRKRFYASRFRPSSKKQDGRKLVRSVPKEDKKQEKEPKTARYSPDVGATSRGEKVKWFTRCPDWSDVGRPVEFEGDGWLVRGILLVEEGSGHEDPVFFVLDEGAHESILDFNRWRFQWE